MTFALLALAWVVCAVLIALAWSAFHMRMERLPSPPLTGQDWMRTSDAAVATETDGDAVEGH